MNCPHCGASNTKALPMVYRSGTTTSKSSSLYITSKGRLGSRGSSGTRQSKLAEAASPPRAPSLVLGFIGMSMVVVVAWAIVANLLPVIARLIPNAAQSATFLKISPLFLLAVPVVIFFVWVIRHRMKKGRFLTNYAVWERSWLCMKCGMTWAY